ncbi:MAG TPA: peptidoglycan DD-metalloendopeptidase family protein [Alphaproteobacteria bacterium]|nr:peptidoglycan DD-metalloendopeptidase family protein [Alphaproteobacteria bacterium]
MLALAAAQPAWAAKPKKTAAPAATAAPSAAQVKALEKQAAESRARAAALAEKTAKMEKELQARRKSLTDTAAQVRAGETTLSKLETEQNALADSVEHETTVLDADKAKLAELTAGLVRLARIPPGGLLTAFDAPVDAARAEILLRSALNATDEAAKRTQQDIARLNTADQRLAAKRRETERQSGVLKSRQADLASLIDKRQAVYQQTESDRQAEEEHARQIAEQARDLRDLVAKIEAQQKAEAEAAKRRAKQDKKAVPAALTGHYTAAAGLPVNGQVKIRFGQNDGLGTTSHGVTVIARPGATVTAPATGTVRFAGPFRGYREILILEHPGGYLSLIAGMSRVNAAVGAQVTAGEPIGTMDDRAGASPELYYELRRNGQFIDPEASAPPGGVKGKVR